MLADEAVTIEDTNAVLGGDYINGTIQEPERCGVVVGMQGDEAECVDGAVDDLTGLADVQRQWPQGWLLDREEFPRGSQQGTLVGLVDLVAPLTQLAIAVGDVGELTIGVEVALDVVEVALDASRAIGVTELVGYELKTDVFVKRSHLGRGHGVSAGAVVSRRSLRTPLLRDITDVRIERSLQIQQRFFQLHLRSMPGTDALVQRTLLRQPRVRAELLPERQSDARVSVRCGSAPVLEGAASSLYLKQSSPGIPVLARSGNWHRLELSPPNKALHCAHAPAWQVNANPLGG
jgi:hypothetical protein